MLRKFFLMLLASIHSVSFIYSQATCQGALGTPIVNNTFGSGVNPGQITPPGFTNYIFQPNATGTPPANVILDGEYALVTQVPSNPNWFLGAPDHTGDPNGYMAFFNAQQQPGGIFYQETVTGICQGTTYQFQAFIANAINPAILPGAVTPDVTFRIFDANTMNQLGILNTQNIPAQAQFTWVPYTLMFTVPAGVNSIILQLTNNNVGGTGQPGNDLALDDITFIPCGPVMSASFSPKIVQNMMTVCSTEGFTLYGTVSAGLNNPTYQWQISSDNGITWTDIPGATGLIFNHPALPVGNYVFRLLSAEAGNINFPNCRFNSNNIFLTVTFCPPPCVDTCYWTVNGNNIRNTSNIFGTLSNDDIRIFSNNTQRGIIKANSYFGWATTAPTTTVHFNALAPDRVPSGLRFENLPPGYGSTLVVDGNGYVYQSKFSIEKNQDAMNLKIEELSAENASLRKDLKKLEAVVNSLTGPISASFEKNRATKHKLFQNKPNPFNDNTMIDYFIADQKSKGFIVVYDLTGKELLRYSLKPGNGNIKISSGQLSNGMYLYTLVVDNVEVDTKKMIIAE
jgi:hypothetical protein